MKTERLVVVLVFALMAVSANVLANSVTNRNTGDEGTVRFHGASVLSGAGIPVSSILGIGTASNAGVQLDITGGFLSFSDSVNNGVGQGNGQGNGHGGDPVPAAEYWNLSTSVMFLALVGGIFAALTRAKVLRLS